MKKGNTTSRSVLPVDALLCDYSSKSLEDHLNKLTEPEFHESHKVIRRPGRVPAIKRFHLECMPHIIMQQYL